MKLHEEISYKEDLYFKDEEMDELWSKLEQVEVAKEPLKN